MARWDGVANTSTSYIREDGWRPGGRIKQYIGGHDETWGGVRINIDRNFLDLGKGSCAAPQTHCGGVRVDFPDYVTLNANTDYPDRIKGLQCLLKEQDAYAGKVNGNYTKATIAAVRAWQTGHGFTASDSWSRPNWMSLAVAGQREILKFGSAGPDVRRIQRALNAYSGKSRLTVSGVFDGATDRALRAYQKKVGVTVSGVDREVNLAAAPRRRALTPVWLVVGLPPQQVARLALEHLAQRLERGEADRLGPPVLQHGEVGRGDADALGERADGHLAPGEHHVDVDDDRHQITSSSSAWRCVRLTSQGDRLGEQHPQHQDDQRDPRRRARPARRPASTTPGATRIARGQDHSERERHQRGRRDRRRSRCRHSGTRRGRTPCPAGPSSAAARRRPS